MYQKCIKKLLFVTVGSQLDNSVEKIFKYTIPYINRVRLHKQAAVPHLDINKNV